MEHIGGPKGSDGNMAADLPPGAAVPAVIPERDLWRTAMLMVRRGGCSVA
jgi:hypothetical protein